MTQQNASISPNAVWLTTTQAAEILGISAQRLSTMCRNGEIPSYRPGGKMYRLKLTDVEAHLEQAKVRTDEEEE